jgi:FtsP/CotA-like multicopper oxidase with cupredoxin domain
VYCVYAPKSDYNHQYSVLTSPIIVALFQNTGGNMCSGTLEPWDDAALTFVSNATGLVGSTYLKAMFVQYTDQSFSVKVARPPEDAYLGFLGPVLRAEVGDTIEVLFENRLTEFPASMHPHGVQYLKDAEGSPYNDGTTVAAKLDDAVLPGRRHFYRWTVPETAGPGPNDTSTILWMYHSHVNEVTNTYAGLVGGIIVGRKGALNEQGTAKDVDREVMVFFTVSRERESLFWAQNDAMYVARDAAAAAAAAASPAAELTLPGANSTDKSVQSVAGRRRLLQGTRSAQLLFVY